MKVLYEKYGHALPVTIYGIIYMLCFGILENRGNVRYMIIHMNIDDYIPFCEVFIVPYLLWFLYIPAVLLYLFFKDREIVTMLPFSSFAINIYNPLNLYRLCLA